jgi:hypothetical protein
VNNALIFAKESLEPSRWSKTKMRTSEEKKDYVDEVLSKVDEMINSGVYKSLPDGCDFSTVFPTYIIAYCPDSCTWFATNNRFFWYEYEKEFENEEAAVQFFKENAKLFYDLEIEMGVQRPSFFDHVVLLEYGSDNCDFIKIE